MILVPCSCVTASPKRFTLVCVFSPPTKLHNVVLRGAAPATGGYCEAGQSLQWKPLDGPLNCSRHDNLNEILQSIRPSLWGTLFLHQTYQLDRKFIKALIAVQADGSTHFSTPRPLQWPQTPFLLGPHPRHCQQACFCPRAVGGLRGRVDKSCVT